MDARKIFTILILMLVFRPVSAEVVGNELKYRVGDTQFNGYIAYDDSIKGGRPGVIVVHEWWGHNEYARKRARMLARLGYSAIALDMYGDGKQASHPRDAGRFSSAVSSNLPEAEKRFLAA
ncbi:MAG: dienelactone hydrolase family protein, partial [Gammaproteobacteria bacterium]|nr:dienelactone hydrolase family protein [Gammaproteobacteria bacterium]